MRDGEPGGACASRGCSRLAVRQSVHEVRLAPSAPFRCRPCVDDIDARFRAVGRVQPDAQREPRTTRADVAAALFLIVLLLMLPVLAALL